MAHATMFRSKTPLSNDQIARYAPSVFASEAFADRSDRYTYIPTVDVLEGLRREGFQPMAVGQTRCRDERKQDHTKHMLRFRHQDALTHLNVGDEIPELVLVNSHDGTSAYNLTGGIYRLVCSNGMVVGDASSEIKVRHSGNVIDNVIEGSFHVVEALKELAPVVESWKGLQLLPAEQKIYADAALGLRWAEGEAPIEAEQLLNLRRWEDKGQDLWKTFNRTQENLIRGGLRGTGSTGRRTSTRAVASVTENIRLNKALWAMTQRMAELKAA